MGYAGVSCHMAGDQTHSTPPTEIARHQLALFESLSDDDRERIIPFSTLETQHYCEQKAQFERTEIPDEESRPQRLIRAQEQHNELIETAGTTEDEYTLADAWDDNGGNLFMDKHIIELDAQPNPERPRMRTVRNSRSGGES